MTLGVAGIAVVTGCSADKPATGADQPPRSSGDLAPDVAVATSALAEIRAMRTAVSGTLSRFPEARATLAPLAKMHLAHEASLADAVPDRADTSTTPTPYAVPRRSEAAFRQLAAREQRLHDTLDALALKAQSGDFARLLASMGAGVGQRLAGFGT